MGECPPSATVQCVLLASIFNKGRRRIKAFESQGKENKVMVMSFIPKALWKMEEMSRSLEKRQKHL